MHDGPAASRAASGDLAASEMAQALGGRLLTELPTRMIMLVCA
jgi:hypothetical protein